jgi:hypothetical protein
VRRREEKRRVLLLWGCRLLREVMPLLFSLGIRHRFHQSDVPEMSKTDHSAIAVQPGYDRMDGGLLR